MIKEFKKFISKGNIIDLAVAVIIGSAFGRIVSSLVNDIIMPLLGTILGGIDFTDLYIRVNDAYIMYGNFLQNVVNFLAIAFSIFMSIKLLEKFNKKEEVKEEIKKTKEIEILEEIRDALKK